MSRLMCSQPIANATAAFLPKNITTSDGGVFQLKRAITDYRSCHDGSPKEARILFVCKQKQFEATEFIVKIKVQLPDAASGSANQSNTTAAEIEALQVFRDADSLVAPHLVCFEHSTQDVQGPLPGGYMNFTIMTKMPGENLLDYKYWSAAFEERTLIQEKFIAALKSVVSML